MDSQASSQQSCEAPLAIVAFILGYLVFRFVRVYAPYFASDGAQKDLSKARFTLTACTISWATSAMSLRSSAGVMMQRVTDACSRFDQRKLITSYFFVVYVCRLLMRLPQAQDMPWPVVMVLEDGLSMMSFVLGMLYLNSSNGAPLRFLVKCVMPSSSDASAVEAETEEESWASAVATNGPPLRLFYFAI